ncbi:MAG TPA: guanylate kinase [Anaerolineae bacterium]|nr:guanylate kinase [Anaerolineae bacterium]
MREGLIVLLVAPSGAGKSTIIDGVISEVRNLERIVTYTTRPKRPGEVEGREYHFVTTEEFERLKAAGQLAEWQAFYGHQYGSSRARLESAIARGLGLIGAYDVLGSVELMSKYPRNATTIFILPPSVEELRRRLVGRYGAETEEGRVRLERLEMEMSHAYSFRYVVSNVDLREAVRDVVGIVRAERCLTARKSPS